ncbi:MAG: SsrA-binding protein [Parcubacteria group bacterium Gr01-1014_48]|nr:MAG: SsrA-binding protein [Parcubacteria group bacterium Greene0416_14]TSC71889.1 MAG: SsrA-binding protein [Parcubacteria group bacterium Gr01-1014_48]TSD01070.1 MAG: SsrA-binding protein [Parcubacteria group bacterium Greene1014_15]TSD08067.1 MAG: SsrA-binding protein [Parcubacteria group bacterium Greene0714_4]
MSLIYNKKAHFNYEVLETFDAGMELFGFEVKALRKEQGSLDGSHVTIRGGEAYLINAHIPSYQVGNAPKDFDRRRNRRLLLTKKEINTLSGLESQKGLTILPISVYNKGRKIKVEIAVARPKKKYDKREIIKKRDADREARRTLKNE